MTIKFHRAFENYQEGEVVTIDPTMEDYLVRRNFADFCETPKVEEAEKPAKTKKVKE